MCKSSKDAETRAGGKCVEDSVYLARRLEEVLHGDYNKRIKVELQVDSEPLIESIRSMKRVENKALCKEVGAMKEALLLEEVSSYSFISTKENPADKMMKATLEIPILPSSAQAPAKPSWAELALFLVNPATHPHPPPPPPPPGKCI